MYRIPLFILSICLLSTCRKDAYELDHRSVDREYVKMDTGSYNIYQVHEITFNDFTNTSDTSDYQLREINESFFVDNLGRTATRIDRHTRNTDTSGWIYRNTWYAVADPSMVERIEENKRLIKLSFPISNDAVWNANAMNTDNPNNVFYGLLHQTYKLDSFSFDSAVSVKSTPRTNNSTERAFEEVYVKHIGLVYKNHVQVDRSGSIRRGFKIKYRLISYGH